MVLVLLAAATVSTMAAKAPGRDPALLHKHVAEAVAEKEHEQEQALRHLLSLGGAPEQQAEITARLAASLRARGLLLGIRASGESDTDKAAAERDQAAAGEARTEAVERYRELLKKYPNSGKQDEALFFLADTLQDSGKDDEAVKAARELVRRFPKSQWAAASHVFIGEQLFEAAKLSEALAQYQAAAEVTTDEVYPYALYKMAWCRFNQNGFLDAMKLLKQVVEVSQAQPVVGAASGGGTPSRDSSKLQLAREARRDYVLVYGRVGAPEKAREEFAQKFGADGKKMLEMYGKLLFDEGRDPEAQLIARQLLVIHGDEPSAALDQTRLVIIATRGGKRRDLLGEAQALVDTFRRVQKDQPVSGGSAAQGASKEAFEEASRLAEETLRNLAVQIHNEAKKTELTETFAAAKAIYTDYLLLFPHAPEAYDLRFFDGELLYGLGEKRAAAVLYEEVVREDLAALKKKEKPGKWLRKAAWSAVLSRSEVAGDVDPQPQPQSKGRAAKATSPAVAQRSLQRALTPPEELLYKSCLLYLEALPDGPHAVEVAFKAGRLEYVAQRLDDAQKHLAWVATQHPEHELAEYAANLVLDIANLRHDYAGMHAWALKFLADPKLARHGALAQDLKRIEKESAYAIADATTPDPAKALALLAYVDAHPHGDLTDKAIFGASAALSRAGRIDDALAARTRLWKEQSGSALVPRALLASAADHAALGDFGDVAALLEKYAAGWRKQDELKRWRLNHPQPPRPGSDKPTPPGPSYEEAKAQSGLHDAAVLREARGELTLALADRTLALQLWKKPEGRNDALFAQAMLRARLGMRSPAARDLAEVARQAHDKPSMRLMAWREAARLFARIKETDHARWAWTELERSFKTLGPKGRAALSGEATTAAAEAHLALGSKEFEDFKQQQIKAPLMVTLNRKIALLQRVKKRAEETVSMRQAEPAVCALVALGEAQLLLGQALAGSPFPQGLRTAEQRKLYRAAINEKAQPIFADAKETLASADSRAHELGVAGPCTVKMAALLDKLGGKAAARPELELGAKELAPMPEYVDADGAGIAREEATP